MSSSRPLLSFSILSSCFKMQQQQQQQQQPQQEKVQKKKIKIKPKVKIVDEIPTSDKKKQELQEKCGLPSQNKKVIIIKKKNQKRSYNDIAPPASMIYMPKKNDIYKTPPKRCCRLFIENKHCFLRECDNACISPISRTVIGFWNEKVGKECKLLPILDETTYEQEVVDVDEQALIETSPSPNQAPLKLISKKTNFVSDAQRARIASEPVALLRDKIAKQYGMGVKKN